MKGRTHLLAGILFSALFLFFNNFNSFTFSMIAFFLVGCLMPDIDESHSIMGRNVKLVGMLFKHRGFFHSVFAAMFFLLIINEIVSYRAAIFFTMGFFLHLALDMITKDGIKPFMYGFHIRGPFRVGGIFEKILSYSIVSCIVIILILMVVL